MEWDEFPEIPEIPEDMEEFKVLLEEKKAEKTPTPVTIFLAILFLAQLLAADIFHRLLNLEIS